MSRYRKAVASIIIAGLLVSIAIALASVAMLLNRSIAEINKASLKVSKHSIRALSEELRLVNSSEVRGYCNIKYFIVRDPQKGHVVIVPGIAVEGYAKLPSKVSEAIAKGYEVKAVSSSGRVFLLTLNKKPMVEASLSSGGIVIPRLVMFNEYKVGNAYKCLLVNSKGEVSIIQAPGVYEASRVVIAELLYNGSLDVQCGMLYEFNGVGFEHKELERVAKLVELTPRPINRVVVSGVTYSIWGSNVRKYFPQGKTVRIVYKVPRLKLAAKVMLQLKVGAYWLKYYRRSRTAYPVHTGVLKIRVNGRDVKIIVSRYSLRVIEVYVDLKPGEDKIVVELVPYYGRGIVIKDLPNMVFLYFEPVVKVPRDALIVVDGVLARNDYSLSAEETLFAISPGKHIITVYRVVSETTVNSTIVVDLLNGAVFKRNGPARIIVPQFYLELYGLNGKVSVAGKELRSINGSVYIPLCEKTIKSKILIGSREYYVGKLLTMCEANVKFPLKLGGIYVWEEGKVKKNTLRADETMEFTLIAWSSGQLILRMPLTWACKYYACWSSVYKSGRWFVWKKEDVYGIPGMNIVVEVYVNERRVHDNTKSYNTKVLGKGWSGGGSMWGGRFVYHDVLKDFQCASMETRTCEPLYVIPVREGDVIRVRIHMKLAVSLDNNVWSGLTWNNANNYKEIRVEFAGYGTLCMEMLPG